MDVAHAIRMGFGAALLLFQLAMIVQARRTTARYFCWAPFDMQTEYWIGASVNGKELSAAEIRSRYRRPAHGVDNRSVQHVIDIIEQVERRLSAAGAEVTMRYRINGKPEQTWRWDRN
jgi:hypothetical protein